MMPFADGAKTFAGYEAVGAAELPRPTTAELSILRVLWRLGPSTVRQIHDSLNAGRRTGYTTVLKLLQIMSEKGLVDRDKSRRSHVYMPRRTETQTQRQLVRDLLERGFGGSARQLAAFREILDDIEKDATTNQD